MSSISKKISLLRLKSFEQNTAEGRAMERHRRIALTAAASALAKVLSVSSALISLPLTLNYLGVERFGMWMTISSLIAMLAFADFGIANGLLGLVAAAHGKNDLVGIRRIVSSSFYLLTAIAIVGFTIFSVVYWFVPWPKVFNVNGQLAATEAGPALAVFIFCFSLSIPFAIVQRVQMGLQQGFAASLWNCFGSVLGLVGVLIALNFRLGLPWLVLTLAGAPLLASMLNCGYFFLSSRPDLKPRRDMVSLEVCKNVGRSGAVFFVLQIVVAVAYTSDSVVIAQLLGASAVADYAVPEKLFGLVSLGLGMVLAPLWPAYGEAISRGDSGWVKATLKRSVLLSLAIAAVLNLALVLLGPELLRLWVSNSVTPSFSLLVAFGVWKSIEAAGVACAMFLNGVGVVRFQVLCAIPTAVCAIFLKIALLPHLGVAGVLWASVIAYLVFTALPLALKLPVLLRTLQTKRYDSSCES
jgi:O-antigen/teichoic acid export membrane protein